MTYPYADNTYQSWNWSVWKPDTSLSINSGYPYFRPLGEIPTQAPVPAIDPNPVPNSCLVDVNTNFFWDTDSNQQEFSFPQGFRLYLGTDNPPSNILSGIDLGYVTSYHPIAILIQLNLLLDNSAL